mgnify:CR=1 FL=1
MNLLVKSCLVYLYLIKQNKSMVNYMKYAFFDLYLLKSFENYSSFNVLISKISKKAPNCSILGGRPLNRLNLSPNI